MYDFNDDQFWQQVDNEEEQRQEEDWQTVLDNDPGYRAWADEMDRQTVDDRQIMDLAMIEDERAYRTEQPWD